MYNKIKLKLENYRDKTCGTQTASMTGMNENNKSESIQINIPMKSKRSMQKQKNE